MALTMLRSSHFSSGLGSVALSSPARFTPTYLPGCVLWLDADRIGGLSDGGAVATWSDRSGQGNDLVQGTAAAKPTYKTAIKNGKPIVRADGTDDSLAIATAIGIAEGGARTFFCVAKLTNAANRSPLIGQGKSGSGSQYIVIDANTSGSAANKFGLFLSSGTFYAAATDTNFHVHLLTIAAFASGDTVSTKIAYYIDGALQSLTTIGDGAFGTLAIDTTVICRYAGAGVYAACDWAEGGIYNRVLSGPERNRLTTYLGKKWGLAVV